MTRDTLEQVESLLVAERGQALLDKAEDQWFDRKSIRTSPHGLANLLISFANAEGGIAIVGLSGGRVEGINGSPTKTNDLLQAPVDFPEPPIRSRKHFIECINGKGDPDRVLAFEVDPSEVVHANQRDEVYLRVGDETKRLTFRQRQELMFDKGQTVYDGTTVESVTLKDLDWSECEQYAETVGHPEPRRLLRARGLTREDDRVTVAGYLLFANHPQELMPEAHVRVLRYLGTERGAGESQNLQSDLRCEGPIPRVLEEAAATVRAYQPVRRALEKGATRFEPQPLLPETVWLEGIVNAVVHRSYSVGGDHIRVDIFDDRIEVESPGRFPGVANPTDPRHIARFARNPRIARVCADLQFGQELGEGIRRMFEGMHTAGLADPIYEQRPGSTRLTLSALPVDRRLEASLPKRAMEVLELVRRAGQLGTGDVQDALAMSRPVVLRRLRALEEAGLIEWVGKSPKDPRAIWRLKW